ncbi:hypothetical protein BC940DRAFT_307245 [Gongronella butleri]|nr:hypothetical protein BC940DRAFT_307245 [Gongronella butleri]
MAAALSSLLHRPPVLSDNDPRLKPLVADVADAQKVLHVQQELARELEQPHLLPGSLQVLFRVIGPYENAHALKVMLLNYFLQKEHVSWSLPFLATHLDGIDERCRDIIGAYCHQWQSQGDDYADLLQHHLMGRLQQALQVSTSNREEILVNCQDKQIDTLLAKCVSRPALYQDHLQQWDKIFQGKPLPPSIQSRLKLDMAMYPAELALLVPGLEQRGVCLQPLSAPCVAMLQEARVDPVVLQTRTAIAVCIEPVLVSYKAAELKLDKAVVDAIARQPTHVDDAIFVECLDLLKDAPRHRLAMLMVCLARLAHKSRVPVARVVGYWTYALAEQLRRVAYVDVNEDKQPIARFLQLVCCFLLFAKATRCTMDHNQEWQRLWLTFDRQRAACAPPSGDTDVVATLVETLLSMCYNTITT